MRSKMARVALSASERSERARYPRVCASFSLEARKASISPLACVGARTAVWGGGGGLGRRWRSGAAVAVWGGRGGGRGTAAQERPQGLARAVVARAAAAWLAATRTAVRPVATQAGWIDAFVKASTVYEPSLSAIFVPQNCGWRGDHELDTETQRKCESAEAQGKGGRSNAVGLSYWRALVLASLLLERPV